MKNKISEKDVQENMQDIIVKTEVEFGKPVTYVTVRMKNGFTVRESTTCVDPENYDEEIGAKICLEKIEDKIWMLLGYQLQEKMSKHDNQRKPSEDKCEGCDFKDECKSSDGNEEKSELKKFMERCKEFILNNDDEDDEVEDNETSEDDVDYVHLSISMSPKVFKGLLDRTMIL